MPTYVFRCAQRCVDVEEIHAMATVPTEVVCPVCGASAMRIVGSPALGTGNSPAMRAQDATRATAEAPAVVSSVPGSRRRATPVTTNPLHRKLPRP